MTLSYGTACVEGIKRNQGKIKILLAFCLIFLALCSEFCFEHIENIFLNNHLRHFFFGIVRVFKVFPSVKRINFLFFLCCHEFLLGLIVS